MSKRSIPEDQAVSPLKAGARPQTSINGDDGDVLDFEDDYEDEFESEDEIFEAGVDGRPDAEREAESKGACRVVIERSPY